MAWAAAHRGTLGTPDHHYPEVARCQKRKTVWLACFENFRISPNGCCFYFGNKKIASRIKSYSPRVSEASSKRALSSVRCKYQDRVTTRAAFISLNKRHIAFHLG